ncbi:tyrosine-type recombinase/integrase [Haloglomus halophilum]|uniref:tyrosine-type recombinase/integrase n=1 Tax=Haloglomus halophilum TaxID=2962672 RepID=UPI0020C93CF4|nr:site-specific integrase [Haloglomus halophilum]
MSRAPDLSPREAVERWLDKLRVDKAEATVSGYWYRLKLFVEWCDEEGIESVRDLSGWDLDSYEQARRAAGVSPVTLSNELTTLRQFLAYCERVELVEEGLPDKIDPPSIDESDEVNSERLESERALALIRAFRDGDERASAHHVALELLWFIGARMGAIRALDVGDVDTDAGTVRFVHRPESDTTLKNGQKGERLVGIPDETATTVKRYLALQRTELVDDHKRRPLLTTSRGRVSTNTIRKWIYYATAPCRASPCPHDRQRATCDWFDRTSANKCPSTLSPHRVRTGSITWQLNRGLDEHEVSRRVNASPETIRKHYDVADADEAFHKRRSETVTRLAMEDPNE